MTINTDPQLVNMQRIINGGIFNPKWECISHCCPKAQDLHEGGGIKIVTACKDPHRFQHKEVIKQPHPSPNSYLSLTIALISFLQWSDNEYVNHTPRQITGSGIVGQYKIDSLSVHVCLCVWENVLNLAQTKQKKLF